MISSQSLFKILMADWLNVQIQVMKLKLITIREILIKNKIQSVLFLSVRLSQRESGWAIFPPGGWIMHGQQKHKSSSEGVRGAMTHHVSSYTSQRCADWSCGEQNDWVTTYHKTTPNQFQIERVVAPISVTHCFNTLHYHSAHSISLKKIYRMGHARGSPHLSLLYSDGINSTFS